MTAPTKKLRRDTRVFISAVTKELGSVRMLVKKALEDNGYHAVEQGNFPPDYHELVEKLGKQISSCDAVIHIAGHCSGGEPQHRPEGVPRRSYTQFEYDLALKMQKPVYVFITVDGFPVDPHQPEVPDQVLLQQEHRHRLTSTDREYVLVASRKELDQKVRSIQLRVEVFEDELTRVDENLIVTGRRLGRRTGAVLTGLIVLLVGIGYVAWQGERSRQEALNVAKVQETFASNYLEELLSNKEILPEQARQMALEKLPRLIGLPPEVIRRLIDGKIAARATDASLSPLERAKAAFTAGNDAAFLTEIEKQHETSRELAMLEGTYYLAQFRRQPKPEHNEKALAAFQLAYALSDPDTLPLPRAEAAIAAANVLHDLARFREAEPLMLDALSLRENQLGTHDPRVATALNNLAQLLQDTNRLADAEPLMRRALTIDEQSYGPDHPNVARDLNNLALLLQDTNRLAEAEPLMRRVVEIFRGFQRATGHEHPHFQTVFANYRALLQAMKLSEKAIAARLRDLAP